MPTPHKAYSKNQFGIIPFSLYATENDDGSGNEDQSQDYSGAGLGQQSRGIAPPAGEIWVVTRVIVGMLDSGTISDNGFGSGSALTNGIIIRYGANGGSADITAKPIKTNEQAGEHMYDWNNTQFAGVQYQWKGRWTFRKHWDKEREEHMGILLNASYGHKLSVILNDDLTFLSRLTFLFQGVKINQYLGDE